MTLKSLVLAGVGLAGSINSPSHRVDRHGAQQLLPRADQPAYEAHIFDQLVSMFAEPWIMVVMC